jgi:hypothetical protein
MVLLFILLNFSSLAALSLISFHQEMVYYQLIQQEMGNKAAVPFK